MASGSVGDVVGQLFAQHASVVYRYCRAQLTKEEAEDVTSEVFIVAYHKASQIPADAAKAWLLGVARKLMANHHRSAKRRRALAYKISLNAPSAALPDLAGSVARADLARQAMARLSQRDREVLWLAATENLSLTELGKALGVSAKGAHMRLTRARQHLAEALASLEEDALAEPAMRGALL